MYSSLTNSHENYAAGESVSALGRALRTPVAFNGARPMSTRIQVLPGTVYGRLTILSESEKRHLPCGQAMRRFVCQCECGTITTVELGHLRRSNTTSCGCRRREVSVDNGRSTRTHGYTGTPTFKSWDCMRQRCNNPQDDHYPNYGLRGITVCDRWQSFVAFLEDMGERPVGHTIDRIDNDGNYEPGNCRWATPKEQARNRSNNVMLTYLGVTCCIGEWSQRIGISSSAIHQRIRRGWSVTDTLTIPAGGTRT